LHGFDNTLADMTTSADHPDHLRALLEAGTAQVSELRSAVAAATGEVTAAQRRVTALYAAIDTRLSELQSAARAVNDAYRDRVEDLLAQVDAAQTATSAASTKLAASLAAGVNAVAALRGGAESAVSAVEKVAGEVKETAQTLAAQRDTLATRMRDRMADTCKQIDTALDTAYRTGNDATAERTGLLRSACKNLTVGLQQHAGVTRTHGQALLTQSRQGIGLDTQRLDAAFLQSREVLKNIQALQISRISDRAREARRRIEDVVRTVERLVLDVAGTTSTVSESMGSVQIGLKVTAGSLQKVQRILHEVTV